MEINGKIIQFIGEQSGTSRAGNPWKKKEWVLETFGSYPRKVKFHVFGERADAIVFEVGKNYTVSCDVESREFNGKWYTDVNVFAARDYVPEGGNYPNAPQQPYVPQGGFQQPMAPTAPAAPAFGAAPQPAFTSAPDNADEDLPF